jgi:hypothetical protein
MVPWLLLLAATGANNLAGWLDRWIGNQRLAEPKTPLFSFLVPHFSFFVLIVFTLLPIPGQWSIPASKEAWRQSVAYLARHAAADHALLIHPDWVRYPFQYYFRGPGQTYAAFSTITPETTLDAPLQGVVGDHPVIWLIQSHLDAPDPERRVERWLASRYPLVTELYPPGIAIKGYAPAYQLDTLPAGVTQADYQFENGLRLAGYQADRVATAADRLFHPPSGWLHVTLYWTATQPVIGAATPFVHLAGPEGIWGISLDRPNDALKLFPPSRWPAEPAETTPSLIIRHDLDVNLNPATPPGSYQLVVGLHGYETQYPLTRVEIR